MEFESKNSIGVRCCVSVCGGDLTALNGTFASPDYPVGYSSAVTCRWTITTLSSRRIRLKLSLNPPMINGSVAIDYASENGACNSSYVVVYNDGVAMEESVTGRLCVAVS
jgi:hypothetical protein